MLSSSDHRRRVRRRARRRRSVQLSRSRRPSPKRRRRRAACRRRTGPCSRRATRWRRTAHPARRGPARSRSATGPTVGVRVVAEDVAERSTLRVVHRDEAVADHLAAALVVLAEERHVVWVGDQEGAGRGELVEGRHVEGVAQRAGRAHVQEWKAGRAASSHQYASAFSCCDPCIAMRSIAANSTVSMPSGVRTSSCVP